jgi:phosphoglycerate kinase
MTKMIGMSDLDLKGKRVLIREDLNVPIRDGIITSDKRLMAALPTIKEAHEKGAAIILLSHLGRPNEWEYKPAFSLKPVATYLAKALGLPVRFEQDYLNGIDIAPGEIVLCENVRFNVGEKSNDEALSKQLAALSDIFVMDAFGTAHREHASTAGVAAFAPIAAAGPLLLTELAHLSKALKSPESPIVAVVGGAKISSKLTLLERLIEKVDTLILGGGIANTFLKARGVNIGASLYEHSLVDFAAKLIEKAGDKIPTVTDVVVSRQCNESAPAYNKAVSEIADDDMILDIGPNTIASFRQKIEAAKTVIWNGPLGVFECAPFAFGTRSIALAIAESDAFTIAGGGDTLSAIDQYNLSDQLSYISTGGGGHF